MLGSLVNIGAAERMDELIADAVGKGAKVVAGGKRNGAIIEATVHRSRDACDAHLPRGILRAGEAGRTGATARRRRSASPTTRNMVSRPQSSAATSSAHFNVAKRIESGICHINGPTVHDEAQMPFGGVKSSGYGRFGSKG